MGARDPARLTAARLAPALLVVVALFGGAIAGAVRTSVSPLAGGVSLDAWRELLEDPAFSESLLLTARVAFLSTLVSVLLAVVLAGALRRRGTLIRALATMPVPVPHLLAAAVAVLWLAPGGLAERIVGGLPVELIRDRQGLGIVLVYVYVRAVHPRGLRPAARAVLRVGAGARRDGARAAYPRTARSDGTLRGVSGRDRPPEDETSLEADLRRLWYASLFFGGCVLVVVLLAVIGLYH